MAITNGYCTLAEFKAYADPGSLGFSTDATDDTVIEALIEAASRRIDRITGRNFYARTETHYFDVPAGRELRLDDDLLTVTTLTNGDGTVLTTADYSLLPASKPPYRRVRLKDTSTHIWQGSAAGGFELVISLAGTWGWSATAPDDIVEACMEITKHSYKRRTGDGAQAATITAAGVVLTPADIPGYILANLQVYKRRT